ncbi:uncharacterized protein K441DRAFT_208695 [Cenococcum geophilum 1.58]|uniref:uncharacterized protein n=1 Tax=Cenococcum geophilum 1.58 TaxID=794803 RepID=UPI00358EA50E|nr:hypothetical protein K441DRAFT_208695 [Cenococcum geophilum 1.58]
MQNYKLQYYAHSYMFDSSQNAYTSPQKCNSLCLNNLPAFSTSNINYQAYLKGFIASKAPAIQVDNTGIPSLRGHFLGLRATFRFRFQSQKAHRDVKLLGLLRTRTAVPRVQLRQYPPIIAPNVINALLRPYSGFFEAL